MDDPFLRVDFRLYRRLLPQRLFQQLPGLPPCLPARGQLEDRLLLVKQVLRLSPNLPNRRNRQYSRFSCRCHRSPPSSHPTAHFRCPILLFHSVPACPFVSSFSSSPACPDRTFA